jgi:hypothetical protein
LFFGDSILLALLLRLLCPALRIAAAVAKTAAFEKILNHRLPE